MNTETTMSPAGVLAVMDDSADRMERMCRDFLFRESISAPELRRARTAVAALIEREASLVAERGNADKYGWTEGYPPYPHGEEWFLGDTEFGPMILRSLTDEYAYDYTTADHTYILKEKVRRWMQLPESGFIAYLSTGEIQELRAERDALIAERDALAAELARCKRASRVATTDTLQEGIREYEQEIARSESRSEGGAP